ncbi:hypothetical protein LY474_03190 [Myxococcus stipitatus]|uniref:tetratricopeptide repeat protein n=1 Tax=Myxococcus stipitatus TaxID=83455 RepID=UPI001F261029|nr:hypothetical protein [Myxococcus stipitatus]MCE9666809.1 hypothetical protein [Myxococcus stipitatus]
MFIRDPADVLRRIPELRVLCEDARVRRAVERGDPFKLYRTLKWARWLGRLRSHREVLDTLLSRRRLFARPLKGSSLYLGTLNGFGAALLGDAEPDPVDGTVIATHSVVALFLLPLLPLGAYVVRRHNESGGGGGWTIFARVPLGTVSWLWSRLVAFAVIALVVGGAGQAFHASRYREVHVGNAFEETLVVTLGDASLAVGPGKVASFSVPMGVQRGRAVSRSGVEVDTVELDVRHGGDLLMWNIAGGMPVILGKVVYSSVTSDDGPAPEVFCGKRIIQLGDIDYLFKEPPERLSTRREQGQIVKRVVKVARSDGDLLADCFIYLGMWSRWAEALPFAEASARLSGWSESTVEQGLLAAFARGGAEATRFTRLLRDAKPENLEWQRAYQAAVENEGRLGALIAEYAERARAAPDSADAQYLHARLLRGAEGLRAIEALSERFPDHVALLRSVVHRRYLAKDWEGAQRAWHRLVTLDKEGAIAVLDEAMTAFVALGKEEEGVKWLSILFDVDEPRRRAEVARSYALVATRAGRTDAEALIARLEKDQENHRFDWLRARAHLRVDVDKTTPGVRLMAMAGRSPREALRLAESLSEIELPVLSEEVWALTYAEAVRTGQEACQRSLERSTRFSVAQRAELRRFVEGKLESLDASDLSWEVRSAAAFVRSRVSGIPDAERKRWVEQARKDDWFRGVVSEAITSWTL